MLEDQLLAEFADRLDAEVNDKLSELDADCPLPELAALTDVMLGYIEDAGSVTSHDLCPHEDQQGNKRCRVVGYALGDDSTRLELFTAHKATESQQAMPQKQLSKLAGMGARFFDYAAKGDLERFLVNQRIHDAATLIHTELERIEDVRVHILTDAETQTRVIDDMEISGRSVSFEVWDLERLYRIAGEDVGRDRIEIDFEQLLGHPMSCLELKPPPREYQTFLLVLPGSLVFKLYEQYGARLFEFNVRSFLQVKGAVNKGMRKTIEEHPGRFLAYNNGITATADEADVGQSYGETVIKRLKGLQIVNGAQTTASIHRACKVDKLPLDQLAVAMKLTLVPPDHLQEFVPLIARFANTQNPIQIADLSASDRFHIEFEKLSQTVWCPGETDRWFYERTRGSYQVERSRRGSTQAKKREFDRTCPKSQHFGKADLAKYLMSWWGLPHIVSRGAQKNYATFMVALRERMGEQWAPDKTFFRDTIAKALLFKSVQAATRAAKLQSYGANVVTYLVARLATASYGELDLDHIWETQEISPEFRQMITTWAPEMHKALVKTAGSRNVTEWCKKEACWDAVQSLSLPHPKGQPPEFRDRSETQPPPASSKRSAQDPVAVCMGLDGPGWARVMTWVVGNGKVQEYDQRVAHTLSGYALQGWKKAPSLKQAVRGVRVLEAARAAGIKA